MSASGPGRARDGGDWSAARTERFLDRDASLYAENAALPADNAGLRAENERPRSAWTR